MKERPIIFSTEMVAAIIDGRKTQTRRVVRPGIAKKLDAGADWRSLRCPHGKAGDRLWVKEQWQVQPSEDLSSGNKGVIYRADYCFIRSDDELPLRIMPEARDRPVGGGWHSPIFMPRWAARLTLEITDIRMEKLQDMTEEDAQKEGFDGIEDLLDPYDRVFAVGFIPTWDHLNIKRGYGWNTNPWVWVITFREVSTYGLGS